MRALLATLLFLPAVASAAPHVSASSSPAATQSVTLAFPADDTSDSVAIAVSGLCSVVWQRAGSDAASLYAVTSRDAAANTGTLIGSYAASTTSPTQFRPGTLWVKAVATTADAGGSVMIITCGRGPTAGGTSSLSSGGSPPIAEAGNPWISCENLPDPAFTPVAVTTADDLHQVVIDECETGCILELAPGTYDDTNVTIGPGSDTNVKVGSWDGDDISGEILIRAANPLDKPILRAEIGNPAAIFYLVDLQERFRLEDLVLDGRKSEQTDAVVDECDDVDVPGTCDSDDQNFSDAGGFNTRMVAEGSTVSCILRVDVQDTVADAFFVRNATATTIEDSTATRIGCTPSTCPGITVPDDYSTNSVTVVGRGMNLVDGVFVAAVGGTVNDVTKQGVQCFGSDQCYLADNNISNVGNAGVTMLGSSGFVWRNTITGAGLNYPPNTTGTSTGNGVSFTDDTAYTGDLNVEIVGNSVSNTHGSGYLLGLRKVPAAESSTVTLTDNTATGTCVTSTNAGDAAFRLGEGDDKFQSIVATENVVDGSDCPYGILAQTTLDYTADDNEVYGVGVSVRYDDVEALDDDGLIVSGTISIDAASVGTLTNCATPSGGEVTITGALEGGVVRTNCGPAHVGGGGSSNWGELVWDADDWG